MPGVAYLGDIGIFYFHSFFKSTISSQFLQIEG
jgi:hypothetical protein